MQKSVSNWIKSLYPTEKKVRINRYYRMLFSQLIIEINEYSRFSICLLSVQYQTMQKMWFIIDNWEGLSVLFAGWLIISMHFHIHRVLSLINFEPFLEIDVFVHERLNIQYPEKPLLMITKRLWLLGNNEASWKWENDFIAKRFHQQRCKIVAHTKNGVPTESVDQMCISVSVRYTMCTTYQFDDFQVSPHQTLVNNIFFWFKTICIVLVPIGDGINNN